MTLRIGTNPIGWSNDDMPEVGGHISLAQCLSEAHEAGFTGIEKGHKMPADPEVLKNTLAQHNLVLVAGWYSTFLLERDAETEFAQSAAQRELLKANNSKIFIVAECTRTVHGNKSVPLSERPLMTKAEWDLFLPRLNRFAVLLREQGFQLVYHHHMGTVIQSADEIDQLMQGTTPDVHLLLDTGHATWAGDNPARLARTYHDRISHVHCKDVRLSLMEQARAENWSFLTSVLAGVYTVPGDGIVDFTATFKALKPYSGWLVVEAEQDPEKANPKHYAQLGYQNLTKFITESGL